jgi:thioredoxin-related protein
MENPWVIQENFFNPHGKRQCKIMNIETLRQIWMQLLRVGTALILLLLSSMLSASSTKDLIQWQDWSEASFIRAKQENKLLLLNLEAVWCHWCHVMDQKTYSDPKVAQLINQHFIPIKVDHDARPDLANQYRDYGWPATIFLDAAGADLVKRAGYIRPTSFVNLLSAIVADPTPEKAALPRVPNDFAIEPALDPTIPNSAGLKPIRKPWTATTSNLPSHNLTARLKKRWQ